jgi:hypothetical protein
MALPQASDQRWSLDFVLDVLADGRRFRVLVIVDDFTQVRGMSREMQILLATRCSPQPASWVR